MAEPRSKVKNRPGNCSGLYLTTPKRLEVTISDRLRLFFRLVVETILSTFTAKMLTPNILLTELHAKSISSCVFIFETLMWFVVSALVLNRTKVSCFLKLMKLLYSLYLMLMFSRHFEALFKDMALDLRLILTFLISIIARLKLSKNDKNVQ